MKKILSITLSVIMLFGILVFSVSCGENDSAGTATFVIATEEKQVYEIPLSELSEGKGLMPAFEYLKDKKGLAYDISGTMINSIGGLENDYTLGSYIYIFTSVEADFDVTEYKSEVEYDGKTLVSAGVGFNEMTLADGAVIYIGLISFS